MIVHTKLLPDDYRLKFKKLIKIIGEEHSRNLKHRDCHSCRLTAFWPLRGEYFVPGNGLMIIGRAVNGWDHWKTNENEENDGWEPQAATSSKNCEKIIKSLFKFPMTWAAMQFGKDRINEYQIEISRYSKKDFRYKDTGGYYSSKRSAFWRVVHQTVKTLNNKGDPNKWSDYLCWSNLYKISPYNGGNPRAWLRDAEKETCIDLLRIEVDTWRPRCVLVLTGNNWYEPFRLKLNVKIDESPGKLVEHIGYRGSTRQKWIFAKHPQGKREDMFVKEITKHLPEHG